MLYMVNYPEVQRKVQKELDEVCGEGLPLLEHRPKYNSITLNLPA